MVIAFFNIGANAPRIPISAVFSICFLASQDICRPAQCWKFWHPPISIFDVSVFTSNRSNERSPGGHLDWTVSICPRRMSCISVLSFTHIAMCDDSFDVSAVMSPPINLIPWDPLGLVFWTGSVVPCFSSVQAINWSAVDMKDTFSCKKWMFLSCWICLGSWYKAWHAKLVTYRGCRRRTSKSLGHMLCVLSNLTLFYCCAPKWMSNVFESEAGVLCVFSTLVTSGPSVFGLVLGPAWLC